MLAVIECGASVIFHEYKLPCQCQDALELTVILNSIQVEQLGDFSMIKEFEIQDACLDLAVSVAPFLLDAPDTYNQAIHSK
jgi:hypothetical protein